MASEGAPLRVVVLEAEHWHAPWYLAALRRLGHRVAGVSSRDPQVRDRLARELGCPAREEYRALVEETRPDFAISFGRPLEMTEIASFLVAEGIPFAMEKPAGTRAGAVWAVASQAAARGVYASIALANRCTPFVHQARALLREGALGAPRHLALRYVTGPATRYVESGCSWMVDPRLAGGGVLVHLGIHYVDMLAYLSGEPWRPVAAFLGLDATYPIEDYALGVLRGPDVAGGRSALATIEVGYTLTGPGADSRWSLFGERGALHDDAHHLRIDLAGHEPRILPSHSVEGLYHTFVEESIRRYQAAQPPLANLEDVARALDGVERFYSLATPAAAVPWRMPSVSANP
jgi:predicted dehydrogenase